MSIDLAAIAWGILGALLVKLLSRERATPTPAAKERATVGLAPDWYLVMLDSEDEYGVVIGGLVDEMAIGGVPWLRVRHPDTRDGFAGTSLYPLADVRAIECSTEDECREHARDDDDDDMAMPPVHREPAGASKAN